MIPPVYRLSLGFIGFRSLRTISQQAMQTIINAQTSAHTSAVRRWYYAYDNAHVCDIHKSACSFSYRVFSYRVNEELSRKHEIRGMGRLLSFLVFRSFIMFVTFIHNNAISALIDVLLCDFIQLATCDTTSIAISFFFLFF